MGQTLRLRPFTTRPKRFYFVFRDASSGQETYETARFLYSDLLDDGTTVLDFNQAYNPPCSFNPHTTCPIPLRENRLPVKVLAGEKAYPVSRAAREGRGAVGGPKPGALRRGVDRHLRELLRPRLPVRTAASRRSSVVILDGVRREQTRGCVDRLTDDDEVARKSSSVRGQHAGV